VPTGGAPHKIEVGPNGDPWFTQDNDSRIVRFTLRAAGDSVGLPSLPVTQDGSVTVQLVNDLGLCWAADYAASTFRNDGAEFRDASD
jgi:streptogramin lyase